MKKSYKNKLPKELEVVGAGVRVENGELIVDVEFKEKFEPKDGDFLAVDNDVFIYNGKQTEESYGAYVGVLRNGKIDKALTDDIWTDKSSCRYATESEKKAFLERLEKECGKRWNAEKKCLEDIYIPEFGDIVKVINDEKEENLRSYIICIFPNKPLPTKGCNFFDIANINRAGLLSSLCGYIEGNKIIPASESEKKELFDKLEKVGKRWNPEKKCLEDIINPKNGDFLASDLGLFICSGLSGNYLGCHCALLIGAILSGDSKKIDTLGPHIRMATEEEKKLLLKVLKEHGKRWNPETKQVEDDRWRAEKGEYFYHIEFADKSIKVFQSADNRGNHSSNLYARNNYFRTPEAAEKVADKIKEILKNSKS